MDEVLRKMRENMNNTDNKLIKEILKNKEVNSKCSMNSENEKVNESITQVSDRKSTIHIMSTEKTKTKDLIFSNLV